MNKQTNFDTFTTGSPIARILVLQGILLLVAALVFWLLGEIGSVPAFAYGLGLMAANAMVLVSVVGWASKQEAKAGQRGLYAAAAARFVVVLAMLALAYGLGLHLLVVAAGMLVAQLAVYISGFRAAYESARLNGGSELG